MVSPASIAYTGCATPSQSNCCYLLSVCIMLSRNIGENVWVQRVVLWVQTTFKVLFEINEESRQVIYTRREDTVAEHRLN